jgi:hypothetical protein
MSEQEKKLIRILFRKLRGLPAFENVHFRFAKITDLGRVTYCEHKNSYLVLLNKNCDFTSTIYNIAHELAHIIADMTNEHKTEFYLAEKFTTDLCFHLLSTELSKRIS